MMKKYRISVGPSRLSTKLTRKTVKWSTLAKRLLTYDVIDMSYDAYLALDRETQSQHKDVGYFIGGQFGGSSRVLQDMRFRSLVTLDIDHIDSWDIDAIKDAYADYAYVVHSTLKHCEDTPRLRLVLPLKREITVDKYEPVARALADLLGLDCFDDTTFQPARIMFWPAVTSDGDIYKHQNVGKAVDADALLKSYYSDWQDYAEWPHSSRVKSLRPSSKKAEDPLTKPGIIGAFNRTFDIHAVIERFDLPYDPTEHDNRYRPHDATGPSGAVVYDDVFLYSHHESDVVGQQNVNAWDLVRLHKFGTEDADTADDTPVMRLPSSKKMAALAIDIPEVEREMRVPVDEMEVLPEAPAVSPKDAAAPVSAAGTAAGPYEQLRGHIQSIAKHDDEAIEAALSAIAAGDFSEYQQDRLCDELKAVSGVGKGTLRKALSTRRKLLSGAPEDGQRVDMERRLIETVLTDHYQGGETIKRVSGFFWTYVGGLWAIEDGDRVSASTTDTLFRLREERPEEEMALVAGVEEGGNVSLWLSRLQKLQAAMLAGREERDDPLRLMRTFPLPVINCRNCELWFDRKGRMKRRKHKPENFFTTRINVAYDPNAKCPEWDRFNQIIWANSSAGVEDMQRHLEELGGYIIQMSRWLKTWVLFHGPKDTGKSTVAEVFKTMLGNAFLGYDMSRFSQAKANQFTDNALLGKLLIVDDDFGKQNALPDQFLKKISEEKSISVEKKGGDVYQFISRALPLICSNHWPKTADLSDAIRERAQVLPFVHKIAGRDKSDARREVMMGELPGILNRFVAGLQRLRERGDWLPPLDCNIARDEWVAHSNIVALFVHQCVRKSKKEGARIITTDAWQVFQEWSREETGSSHTAKSVIGRDSFYDKLDSLLGPRIAASGNRRVYPFYVLDRQPHSELDDVPDDNDADWLDAPAASWDC